MYKMQNLLSVWIFTSVMFPTGFTQMITGIKPQQLDELEDLCPEEEVFITCETRGSPIIAWTSDEYIEQGGTQLEFATFNRVGETRSSPVNPNTIATLTTNAFDLNGHVQVLQTRLRIVASVDSTVTCINVGNGMTTSVRIQILANPERPQLAAGYQIASENNCDLHLSWNIPSNVSAEDLSHFTVRINETHENNVSVVGNDGGSIVTVYRQCSCGSHDIDISAINRCGSASESTLTIVENELPVSQKLMHNMTECPGSAMYTTMIATTGSGGVDSEHQGLSTPTIAIIVLSGLLAIVLLVSVILTIILGCVIKRTWCY